MLWDRNPFVPSPIKTVNLFVKQKVTEVLQPCLQNQNHQPLCIPESSVPSNSAVPSAQNVPCHCKRQRAGRWTLEPEAFPSHCSSAGLLTACSAFWFSRAFLCPHYSVRSQSFLQSRWTFHTDFFPSKGLISHSTWNNFCKQVFTV